MERLAPWLDTELLDLDVEEWRDVTGYENQYQVSSHGRVKSLARPNSRGQALRARILRQQLTRKGEYTVNLYREGILHTLAVLALVGQAFLPKNGQALKYIRLNKDQRDNRVSNLRLGTQSESVKLSIALGKFSAGPGNTETGNCMVHQAREHLQQHGIFQEGVLVAKICKTCHLEQPLENYYAQKGRTDLNCKTCVLASRKRQHGTQQLTSIQLTAAGLRRCRRCQVVKPLADFAGKRGGFRNCQACRNLLTSTEPVSTESLPVTAQKIPQPRTFFFNQFGSCVEPEVVLHWQPSRNVCVRITVAQHQTTGRWAGGGQVDNGSKGGNLWPCGMRSAYHVTGSSQGYATRAEAARGMFTRIFAEAGDILNAQMLEVLRAWAYDFDRQQVRPEL